MSPSVLYAVALTLVAATAVSAQANPAITGTYPPTPIASKRFPSPTDVPYKVDTDVGLIRGVQHGYNICNGTTEGQTSQCQTSYVNSIDDFCLWAPDKPDSVIGNVEGETVAWCTKPGRGTRLIPADALKGVQFMKTSAYVQVVGFIDQSKINIQTDDFGGEMDPHGADLRGNPMGGLMFSNAFESDKSKYGQVVEWTNFMGGNAFCIKVCDQTNPSAADYCEHIYDRIGCFYNMPNFATTGTFESCEGELQDFPGIYTDKAGAVQTYTQPGEGTVPTPASTYDPRVPASSNCVAQTSSVLYAALASVTAAGGSSPSSSGSAGVSASVTGSSGTAKPTGSVAAATGSKTASGSAAPTASGNSAEGTAIAMGGLGFLGVLFSAVFLA